MSLHPVMQQALASFAPPEQRQCGECGRPFTPTTEFRRDAYCSSQCVNWSLGEGGRPTPEELEEAAMRR